MPEDAGEKTCGAKLVWVCYLSAMIALFAIARFALGMERAGEAVLTLLVGGAVVAGMAFPWMFRLGMGHVCVWALPAVWLGVEIGYYKIRSYSPTSLLGKWLGIGNLEASLVSPLFAAVYLVLLVVTALVSALVLHRLADGFPGPVGMMRELKRRLDLFDPPEKREDGR